MKTNITDNITIREVRISDSQKIYNAIHLHREYLQEWLPFVTFLTAEEEKAFLSSVLRVPRAVGTSFISLKRNKKCAD